MNDVDKNNYLDELGKHLRDSINDLIPNTPKGMNIDFDKLLLHICVYILDCKRRDGREPGNRPASLAIALEKALIDVINKNSEPKFSYKPTDEFINLLKELRECQK